jgi:hypothetical protein
MGQFSSYNNSRNRLFLPYPRTEKTVHAMPMGPGAEYALFSEQLPEIRENFDQIV